MDVNNNGVVSSAEFERGLHCCRVFGSPLVGYKNEAHLFRAVDHAHHGSVFLQEFLGYVPIKHPKHNDTKAEWTSYNNKTSAMKSRLVRKPLWHEFGMAAAGVEHRELQRQRRELKSKIIAARDRGGLKMEGKRRLVRGLVADEDRDEELFHDQCRLNEQKERIGNAINSCSKARADLVALQQAMKHLSPKRTQHRKKDRLTSTMEALPPE